jgi:hypothetical protein
LAKVKRLCLVKSNKGGGDIGRDEALVLEDFWQTVHCFSHFEWAHPSTK